MQSFDFAAHRRDWNETDIELTACREQRNVIFDRLLEARYPLSGSDPDMAVCAVIEAEMTSLEEKIADLRDRQSAMLDAASAALATSSTASYSRPSGRFLALLNRPLGRPAEIEVIRYSREEFRKAPAHPVLVVLAVTAMIGLVVTIVSALPAAATSPTSLALGSELNAMVIFGLMTVLVIFVFVQISRFGLRTVTDWFFRAALLEEQWFRSGAETWSWPQRLYSCVAFGAIHLLNLIYAIANLVGVTMVGAILLAVYLRRIRAGGDQRAATIEAAKVHAHYNMVIMAVLTLMLGLGWALLLLAW